MENLTRQLQEQLKEIDSHISTMEKKLGKHANIPQGVVKVSYCKGIPQYYLKLAGESKFRYVRTSKAETVHAIIQNDYDMYVYKKLQESHILLSGFLKKYHIEDITGAYESLGRGRKKMVDPIIIPDDEFIPRWYEKFKTEQNGFRDELQYRTDRDEYVRSKSEKILADTFNKHSVPYVYEPMIKLNNGHTLFPDFALLNVRKRKTIYWEHFGLINDPEYTQKSMKKLDEYERNGLLCGDNLIFSTESRENPLNLHLIENKIRLFLK